MRYAQTTKGENRTYEMPVVHGVYELIYPRTAALDRQCTLVTIPGKQPSVHLNELEELIAQHRWLEDGFLILFVPACTKEIHDRLTMRYPDSGLVIIDADTLLDLVLAEIHSVNPLACLRPLMLNANGASHSGGIFKVNQLVQSRTSIFVGRESLVKRIITSRENYAIYGGRRIGKSSVLLEIQDKLRNANVEVTFHSFDGDCSDNSSARKIARKMKLSTPVLGVDDLKPAIQNYLNENSVREIAILLDEIDDYIHQNPERHVLIQILRALSDENAGRFRVIVAGFMNLFDCVNGKAGGPHSPSSDPWIRMFKNECLPNLDPTSAEKIVNTGFREILGWSFESIRIPPLIVEKTGGHPAFVQYFCMKLQHQVAKRGDRKIRITDLEVVFNDENPTESFIAHVKETLRMNIEDPFGRYLLLYLAVGNKDTRQFVKSQARECADLFPSKVDKERLEKNLDHLCITSVVKRKSPEHFEFAVPDYPSILSRLGDTAHIDELEKQL